MTYDPTSSQDRHLLAEGLKTKLGEIGFTPSQGRKFDPAKGSRELILVFRHRKDPGLIINVFTSITGDTVRGVGKDAIRITTEYENKSRRLNLPGDDGRIYKDLVFKRPLQENELSAATVQRRGNSIEDIVNRVVDRARSAYRSLNQVKRCPRCQSPIARSFKGNEFCAEVCWK